MICPGCKGQEHFNCANFRGEGTDGHGTWCDCQHDAPIPAQTARWPINQPKPVHISMPVDLWQEAYNTPPDEDGVIRFTFPPHLIAIERG